MIKAPVLKNDCFALPPGVHWTPVAEALTHLRNISRPLVGVKTVPLGQSCGFILAQDVIAKIDSPPESNSAVDGYAITKVDIEKQGNVVLKLMPGRSAAGAPFEGEIPNGHALRILTGAALPSGADAVILQEDVNVVDSQIAFNGPLKLGTNTRKAGEDVFRGKEILPKGHKISAMDIGFIASVGVHEVDVYEKLRVGVLSTGDELIEPDRTHEIGKIYDANRPMLLSLLSEWGFEAIDMGCASDNRNEIRQLLLDAYKTTDVVLTSGGASGGDEDHISALLNEMETLGIWRVAIKPGRPLALGVVNQVPIFGLPGNPVAAGTCAMVFAKPALNVFAGGHWLEPQSFLLPANFTKSKKAGRREFLRARVTDGQAEVFKSEGSGRISGLSWAHGFVELPDEAVDIAVGTPVKFIPFVSYSM